MIITKISQQVKNPNRVSVFVDGKYSFSFDLDQLLKTKLKAGLEINSADLKAFKKMSADGKLKLRTLEWLMIRPHSNKELITYLKKKNVSKEQIDQWCSEFSSRGYQDDEKFAIWWVDQRRSKQKSTKFIRQELYSKGVSNEIINQSLNNQDDKQVLKTLIDKKRKLTKYQDNKKLTEYLVRQGYSYSLVKELLAE